MPDELSTTSVTWQPPEGGSVTVTVRDSSKMPTEADYPVLRESTALAMAEAIARMAALLDGN